MSVQFGYRPSFSSPFFPPSRGHNIRSQQIRDAERAAQEDARQQAAIIRSVANAKASVEARRRARLDRALYRLAMPVQRRPVEVEIGPLLPMARITAEVCLMHRVTVAEVRGNSRSRKIIPARFEAMYRCRKELGKSLSELGKFFSRDHTTVMHAIQAYEARMRGGDS